MSLGLESALHAVINRMCTGERHFKSAEETDWQQETQG